MRVKTWIRFVALLAVVALALPALAKPISKSVNITQPAKLGSTQLTAGEYRLLIDGDKVTVQRDRKVIAQVTGHWEQRETKSRYNSVLLGSNGEVQEVRFEGDSRVLVLSAQ